MIRSGVQLVIKKLQYCIDIKVLQTIVNAPWYVPNKRLHTDLKIPTVGEEITKFNIKCGDKYITTHPNEIASTLLEEEEPKRLKIFKPTDLTTQFS
jgi:hypothetical protein